MDGKVRSQNKTNIFEEFALEGESRNKIADFLRRIFPRVGWWSHRKSVSRYNREKRAGRAIFFFTNACETWVGSPFINIENVPYLNHADVDIVVAVRLYTHQLYTRISLHKNSTLNDCTRGQLYTK